MDSLTISLVVGGLVLAGFVGGTLYLIHRLKHRLKKAEAKRDDEVEMSPADFESSEFRAPPKRARNYIIIGAVILLATLIALAAGVRDPIIALAGVVVGIGMMVFAWLNRDVRVVFRDWQIFMVNGEKTKWKVAIQDITEVVRVYVNGTETQVVLKTHNGKYKVTHTWFENPRKLRLMLSEPQRVFEENQGKKS